MKTKTLLLITTISTLIFTGCQNNNLSAENQALKQEITKLKHQIGELEQQTPSETTTTTYTMEELSGLVDEFVTKVGSATPDINNSGNLDQFFSLKREGDQIEHALENQENTLESQYRTGSITREAFRKLDREIEKLNDELDSACDRLEIAFGIDD